MVAFARDPLPMPSAQLKVLSGGPKVIPAPSAGTSRTESKPEVDAEFDRPSLYLNPELSLLEFQCRVLEEARDARNPLLERVKFLAILSSNLDEFFMVRVAGLLQQIENGVQDASIDGRQPGAQLSAIRTEVTRLIGEAYAAYREELLPSLADTRDHHHRIFLAPSQPAGAARNLLRRQHLSRAHAARFRSRPAISAYLKSEPQSGRGRARFARRRTLRTRESAR